MNNLAGCLQEEKGSHLTVTASKKKNIHFIY